MKSFARIVLAFVVLVAAYRPIDSIAAPYGRMLRAPDARVAAELPNRLRSARVIGALPGSRMLRLNVHLAYPHPEAVRRFTDIVNDRRSPMFGHFLTPQQFVDAFAPSEATYAAVARELGANGLTTWHTWPNRKMLSVTAPASTVERYFRTRIARVSYLGREHFANVAPAVLPQALRGTVMAVTGFDDFLVPSHLHPAVRTFRSPNVIVPVPVPVVGVPVTIVPPGISPLDMQTAYNYPIHSSGGAVTGKGVTIAIEAAYGFSPADINYFWSAFNVKRTGTLSVIDPDGNVPAPTHPTDSAEVTVDVEQSTSNAPGANEKVYTVPAPLTIALEDTYNAVANDAQVDVVSTSFGSCESNTSLAADQADADTFEQSTAEGQTLFAAAGDDGSSDCRANGPDSVDFPASSIEEGSAGGTSLVVNTDHTIKTEVAWSCTPTTGATASACGNGAGGGGISAIWSIPPWQVGLSTIADPASKVSAVVRNVPDVSLNADLNTSYAVWFFGTADLGYGGTSLVGPNLAAIFAQYEEMSKHRIGRSSNVFYNAFVHGGDEYATGAYHDMTVGFNLDGAYTGGTGFKAYKGFDVDTGWGSLDATKLYTSSVPVPQSPSNL